ncbi:MAG TPA: tRNA cyclic N6-threonylcarbamoyladenosine(37) synthase TcdA [Roseimicrobium sp.]|nr:tRNA cyclic N6-threonylcarbamoyladenosine(37) synthase TcdA [Roseimicrobium sp.]
MADATNNPLSATLSDYHARFSGIGRLYGVAGWERLRAAHVCVIGLGGVGSWVVEALARSGIGAMTLVDMDDICVTNVNRQLPALDGQIGRTKVASLAERVRAISPQCKVTARMDFFTPKTSDYILSDNFSLMVDAIDSSENKCLLLAECRRRGLPIITCGGAGGRKDPTQVRIADVAMTTHDPLMFKVRRVLRAEYGFPRDVKEPFGIPCVYSPEEPVYPQSDGSVCDKPEAGSELRLNCDSGFGTASFVTGTFGFVMAAEAVRMITTPQ